MSSRELIQKAFKLEKVERIPWVPFVGVHGAKLLDITASQYLQSEQHIIDGVDKAIELYQPDGMPVVFDLQLEAEILGCKLAWADHNPPAVISHPLAEGSSLEALSVPKKDDGRIGIVLNATRKLRKKHQDIALYGLITGPFTLALHLLGTDIFIKMMEEPEEMHQLLKFTKEVGLAMANYHIEAGCDIVAVVDPMTSQIDPASFEMFVTQPAKEIFNAVNQQGALGSFFVCGHAQQNIEAMCDCEPDNISIDENIPLDFVKEIALARKISFGGNMKLTTVLLMGTEEDVQYEALECMDLGGKEGFILAPGCDLPMDTPIENIKAVTQLVHDPYEQDVLRTLEKKEHVIEMMNMKDYGQADKVIVDIITLDSESCAPCQYMVEAVKKVAPHFDGIVEWREHPIKKLDAVTFMSSLMVKNIPTICIDGKIAFVSQIPPRNRLIEAIQSRINDKFRLKIRSKKGELMVFGKNKEECESFSKPLRSAINELGADIEIRYVTEPNETASFGITKTPAVVLAEYKLKVQGETPVVDIVKEWIKDI